MISTYRTALELRRRIADAIAYAEDVEGMAPAMVTMDPTEASHALAGGQCVVHLPAPRITNQGPVVLLRFDVVLIAPWPSDMAASWVGLDTLLSALDSAGAIAPWEDAEPISWSGSQGATYPGYSLTLTLPVSK